MLVAPIAGLLAPRLGVRDPPRHRTGPAGVVAALDGVAHRPRRHVRQHDSGVRDGGRRDGFDVRPPNATAVLADMPDADHGTASSTNATLREIGVALGIALLTAVFLGAGRSLTPTGYIDASRPALYVGAGFVAVGGRRRRPHAGTIEGGPGVDVTLPECGRPGP